MPKGYTGPKEPRDTGLEFHASVSGRDASKINQESAYDDFQRQRNRTFLGARWYALGHIGRTLWYRPASRTLKFKL